MPVLAKPETKPPKIPLGKAPIAPVTPILKKPEVAPLIIDPPVALLKKPEDPPLSNPQPLVQATLFLVRGRLDLEGFRELRRQVRGPLTTAANPDDIQT